MKSLSKDNDYLWNKKMPIPKSSPLELHVTLKNMVKQNFKDIFFRRVIFFEWIRK